MHTNNRFFTFPHTYCKHVLEETASGGKDAFVSFDPRFVNDECYIGKVTRFKKLKHVFMEVGLRNLHSNVEHPDVVETKFAIVASEHIKLALDNICSMSASWSWPVVTCLYLFPMI